MHYLDNSATTCVYQDSAKVAYDIMTKNYGNPSSLHKMGYDASLALDNAREVTARLLASVPPEVK